MDNNQDNSKINADINTYISAKWNIQICQSGDHDGSNTIYPFGKEMRNNAILDAWLKSIINLFSQYQSNTVSIGGAAIPRELTRGYMQLGDGIKPISYSDISLSRMLKETDYIRPYNNFETGYGVIESGVGIFKRTYDFLPEVGEVTYTEAGFRPYAASLLSYGNPHRNQIWSRFLFTQPTGVVGFLSGYIDNSGFFRMFNHEIDQVSGVIISGKKYNIQPFKSKKNEKIIGYISGFRYPNGNISGYNLDDPRYNLSGYFISGKKYIFNPTTQVGNTQPIIGFISGYCDEYGNFSGFNDRSIYGNSGYYLNNNQYSFLPKRYFSSEVITGYISGEIDKFNNFSGFNEIENAKSGYFIDQNKYNFPTGDQFSGFSGQQYFYDDWGYNYSGFKNLNSGFIGQNKTNEKIIGYISGILNENGIFSGLQSINPLSGSSGYFIDSNIFSFSPIGFDRFENQTIFNKNFGYKYTGFSFPEGSGFTDIQFITSGLCKVTGYIGDRNYYTGSGVYISDIGNRIILNYSGNLDSFNNTELQNDILTHSFSNVNFFVSGSGFYNIENIIGYISGILNPYSIYSPITGNNAYSGYILSGKKFIFNKNILFSGFSGQEGFNTGWGFAYSGFKLSSSGDGIFSGFVNDKIFGNGELFERIGSRNYPIQENIIGFRSGVMNSLFNFSGFNNRQNISGYFISGQQYYFETGSLFSGFSGAVGFSNYLGYNYNGFSNQPNFAFSGINSPTGTGILTGIIGYRNILTSESISGFAHIKSMPDFYPSTGYDNASGFYFNNSTTGFTTAATFIGFDNISGFSTYLGYEYSGYFANIPEFSGVEFSNSGTGILTGIIGYRIAPGYGALTGIIGTRNIFYKSGKFEAFENNYLFEKYLLYKYTGFSFPDGSGFSGINSSNTGYGIITGFIGDRNVMVLSGRYSGLSGIPTHEYGWYYTESGFFASGLPNFTGVFSGGSFDIRLTGFSGTPFLSGEKILGYISGYINEFGFNSLTGKIGHSGYYLSGKQRFFNTGSNFSGFSGQSGFDFPHGYAYTGFSFPDGSGFSGINWPVVNRESVVGFLSGYMNQYSLFLPYQNLYPELSSSGYFLDQEQKIFPTGNLFSGFANELNSNLYEYSGFFIDGPSGFSGTEFSNSGNGILTGIIGYKNNLYYPLSGSGIVTGFIGSRNHLIYSNSGVLTGFIGYKNYISGLKLTYGQFVRLTYETITRIPALTGITPITGSHLVNGTFIASGKLKLVGLHEYIFGYWPWNTRGTERPRIEGFWWPVNPTFPYTYTNSPYPNSYLSANLIASGFNTFPPLNQIRKITPVFFDNDEIAPSDFAFRRGVDCGVKDPCAGGIPIYYFTPIHASKLNTTIYPWFVNKLLIEDYNPTMLPTYTTMKMTFLATYPQNHVAVNGIMISSSTAEYLDRNFYQAKPYEGDNEWARTPCDSNGYQVGDYYVNSSLGCTAWNYGISGRQGIGWVYLFDKPQMKYQDQKIELNFRFSMQRDRL